MPLRPASLHPDAGDSPFDTVRVGACKEQMLLLEDGLHLRRAPDVIDPRPGLRAEDDRSVMTPVRRFTRALLVS